MNQTTAIISGGVAIVAIALALYVFSGDDYKRKIPPASKDIAIEDKTLTLPPAPTPLTSEVVITETPMAKNETQIASTRPEVTLKTSMGDITVRLHAVDAPKTVENFLKLAKSNFYDGVKFHRVIKGFMVQGGDPLTKDDTQMARWGTGGPGYQFADEINLKNAPYQKGYKRGVLAMANSGPNTNGSQFFIMHRDYPLPPSYTIFGEVINGQDVVDAIANTTTTSGDRPLTPVTITSVEMK